MKALAPTLLALTIGIGFPAFAADRPPQYVAIAFDNCTELSRWQELSDFAKELNKDGDKIRFTFFVSGINYLANEKRAVYQGPHQARGYSMINFGGTPEDIEKRVAYMNELKARGHEIASHAVGHFDGRSWSAADWQQEFKSYAGLLDNVAANNGLQDTVKFGFPASSVVGFRAPYLANGAGLYIALKNAGFRYDTSGTSESNLWPEKKDGIWRFNLVGLRLHRSRKRTLSMDYNFFAAQSFALDNPATRTAHREEALETYLNYFKANYSGNRAPLHIGHHFSAYHGDIYNEALKIFIRKTCGLPEVKCVTYSELADFMDGLSPETLQSYRNGDFPRVSPPPIDAAIASRN